MAFDDENTATKGATNGKIISDTFRLSFEVAMMFEREIKPRLNQPNCESTPNFTI